MFKNMLKGKGGAATPAAGSQKITDPAQVAKALASSLGGGKGGAGRSLAANMAGQDEKTQAIIKKILASQGVKMNKGGKVNSKSKAKPMKSKKKSTSKKVSGHNRLY